jgi:PKD repeat protein
MYQISCTQQVFYSTNTSSSGTSGSGSGSGSSTSGNSGNSTGTTGTSTGTGPTAPTPLTPVTTPGTVTPTIGAAGFTAVSTSPCSPSHEVFTFRNATIGIPSGATYQWYFGDGNSSVGASDSITTYTYAAGGNYTVLMKAIYNGQQLVSVTKSVTAYGQNVTPVAAFTTQLVSGNNYNFNSTSTVASGTITNYTWNFGDNTNASSANTFVQHTFAQVPSDQIYKVTLTATSNATCSSSIVNSVTVPAVYTISGGFLATSTNPCAPSNEVFTFTQNITGAPANATYNWDFGDGTGSTGSSVTKTFANPNSNTVTLSVSNSTSVIYKISQTVVSFGQNVTPSASFYFNSTNSAGTAYNFNSTSTIPHGSISSYSWNFGDGGTATTAFTSHTYTAGATSKTYTINLTVTGNAGCTSSASNSVTIP